MIKKIVLTGGPATGKTSVLNKINQVYTELGYKVIIVDEAATELIKRGIKPFGEQAISMVDFQELVLRLQLAKEQNALRFAELLNYDKTLIIYDRGIMDNLAYITEDEFKEVLQRLGITKGNYELKNRYDMVIALKGKEEFYTTLNNEARSEDAYTALILGDRTIKGWLGHPNLKIVLPKTTLEEKMMEVINIINEELKEQKGLKQIKYLVSLKDSDLSKIMKEGMAFQIEQVYLEAADNIEKRLRKIKYKEEVNYYFSVYKIQEDGNKVMVQEKEIDEDIYNSLLEFSDEKYDIIKKMRYYFNYEGMYAYLDIFSKEENWGILEVKVKDDLNIKIPPFLKVTYVGSKPEFLNKSLALKNSLVLNLKKFG